MFSIAEHFIKCTLPIRYTDKHYSEKETVYILNDGDIVTATHNDCKILKDNHILVSYIERGQHIFYSNAFPDDSTALGIGFKSFTSNENYESYEEMFKLFDLFVLYRCYCNIVWDEKIEDDSLITRYMKRNYGLFVDDISDLCWSYIEIFSRDNNNIGSYQMLVDPAKKIIQYEISCSDLISALYTQLLFHISYGEAGLEGYEAAFCKRCGNIFRRNRKNILLCEECKRESNSIKCRKYRERKKEMRINASQDNP